MVPHLDTDLWNHGHKLYVCALLDGLGHATWSSTMPVSRSRTAPFLYFSSACCARAVGIAHEPVYGACSARIRGERHTHTHTQTHRASTVTLAAHAHRGLTSAITNLTSYLYVGDCKEEKRDRSYAHIVLQ